MKLYIDSDPQTEMGSVFHLVDESGKLIYSHFCSSLRFAYDDLVGNMPDRQKYLFDTYGEYEILWVGDDEITSEELRRRNKDLCLGIGAKA